MAINVGSAFAYSFLTTLGTNGGPGIPKDFYCTHFEASGMDIAFVTKTASSHLSLSLYV